MSRPWIAILLAIIGLTLLVGAAAASPLPPLSTPRPTGLALEEAAFEEEEWELEEGCFEEGLEVFCEEEAEEADPSRADCPLRSTHAHAVSYNERLKVTIGYTTYRPTAATIQVGRGSTGLGTFRRQLSRSGVLRFTGKLGKRHGKKLVVSVRVPSAGRYCEEDAAVLFK